MPHLVEMHEEFEEEGFAVIGITEDGAENVRTFRDTYAVSYPLLTDAGADAEAWGVDLIWGSEIYLVDPEGLVVARGLDDSEAILRDEFDR